MPALDDFLTNIAQVESSGGRNTAHPMVRGGAQSGTHAVGNTALMPRTILALAQQSPGEFPELAGLSSPDDVYRAVSPGSPIERRLSMKLAGQLTSQFPGNRDAAAVSWYSGPEAGKRFTSGGKLTPEEQQYLDRFHSAGSASPPPALGGNMRDSGNAESFASMLPGGAQAARRGERRSLGLDERPQPTPQFNERMASMLPPGVQAQRNAEMSGAGPSMPPYRQAPQVAAVAGDGGFGDWYSRYAQATGNDPNPDDPRHHYDYRGFFQADHGATPVTPGMHLPDTFKEPGHPTFSNESVYAKGPAAATAGSWEGERFIPPGGAPSQGSRMMPPSADRAALLATMLPPEAQAARSGFRYQPDVAQQPQGMAGPPNATPLGPSAADGGQGWTPGAFSPATANRAAQQESAIGGARSFIDAQSAMNSGGMADASASLPGSMGVGGQRPMMPQPMPQSPPGPEDWNPFGIQGGPAYEAATARLDARGGPPAAQQGPQGEPPVGTFDVPARGPYPGMLGDAGRASAQQRLQELLAQGKHAPSRGENAMKVIGQSLAGLSAGAYAGTGLPAWKRAHEVTQEAQGKATAEERYQNALRATTQEQMAELLKGDQASQMDQMRMDPQMVEFGGQRMPLSEALDRQGAEQRSRSEFGQKRDLLGQEHGYRLGENAARDQSDYQREEMRQGKLSERATAASQAKASYAAGIAQRYGITNSGFTTMMTWIAKHDNGRFFDPDSALLGGEPRLMPGVTDDDVVREASRLLQLGLGGSAQGAQGPHGASPQQAPMSPQAMQQTMDEVYARIGTPSG